MHFKDTKSFKFGRILGIIYLIPIIFCISVNNYISVYENKGTLNTVLFIILCICLAFIGGIMPILTLFNILFLINDIQTIKPIIYSKINLFNWIFYILSYIIPLGILVIAINIM